MAGTLFIRRARTPRAYRFRDSVEELFEEVLLALLVGAAVVAVLAVAVVLVVARRGWLAVERALGIHQPLELAAVQEQAAAIAALVDRDAVALVGAHLSVALRAGHAAKLAAVHKVL
jgi:hypothetical protein